MYFSRVRLKQDIRQSSNLHRLIQGNSYSVHQLLWDLFPDQEKRPFIFREEIAGEQLGYRPNAKGEPVYYLVSKNQPLQETALFVVDSKSYAPQVKAGDRLAFKLRANPVVARRQDDKKNSSRHDIVMDAQRQLLIGLGKELGTCGETRKSSMREGVLAALQTTNDQRVYDALLTIIRESNGFADRLHEIHKPERLLHWALKACADKSLERWLIEKGARAGFNLVQNNRDGVLAFQAEGYRWHALPRKGKTAGFSTVDFEGSLEVTEPDSFLDALFKGIGPAKGFGCGLMLVRRV